VRATEAVGLVTRLVSIKALSTVAFVLGLAGCGGGGGGGGGPPPPPPTYTVGVTVSGVGGGNLILRLNNGSDLTVTASGSFTFGASLASGATYTVTIASQPTAQTCTVTGGSGTINSANVSNVTVACTNVTFTVGGTLSGLSGTAVLQNNGGNDLSLSASGTFTFSNAVTSGAAYNVTVLTQPATQNCVVTNGTGNAAGNVSNVAIACTTKSYTIGGTLSGLSGTVVLQNNGGNNLSLSANGGFVFTTSIAAGTMYGVTVLTQPAGQTCSVSSGSGTALGSVTNVAVTCSTKTYTIGGTVSGLTGTVVLQNNSGNNLSLSANGGFTFTVAVASGAGYSVTVLTQPAAQSCVVTNGSGTVSANVTNIAVTCTDRQYTIGGTVSGLSGTVVLKNNAGDNLSLAANGAFTFATALASGAAYNVTIATQPSGQTCSVSNGSGNAAANVTNVAVTCTTNTYTIGGTLSGVVGTVVLQNNAGSNLSLSANGGFTFNGTVTSGAAYSVTVLTQPSGQTCSVSNGSGAATANVTNVIVTCIYPQLAANGTSLTVTTANTIATFAGADLVGYQNRLTGETYLTKPSHGELAIVNTMQSTGLTLQTSNWSVAPEGGTGAPLAVITVSDSVRSLTLKVKIDTATDEIIVKPSATTTMPGLRDASWSIAGLDFNSGRLIVPSFTGEVFDAKHAYTGTPLVYPSTWHAQMFVYEAAQGSFLAYSTDSQYLFKDLRTSTRGAHTVDLAIATEAQAPFTTATAATEVEWRLKAFTGGWRIAAQVYKDWLTLNRPPISNAAHPWVQSVRTVVGVRVFDESWLNTLASLLTPSQTLLYLSNWRAAAYDNNYPDYTPRSGVASFVSHAHTLGFKVMLHIDMIGVSTTNADYNAVKNFQVKTPDTLQLMGWVWDCTSCAYRFAYISPASSAYRTLLINRLGTAVNAVNPDALHLDISGPMDNDGNGLIEGMTYPQGSVRLHQDLMAAFPNLVLGGEGENDVIYGYQSFAQSWSNGYDFFYGHPIANFLFSPSVQYYGHLGQPLASDPSFKDYLSQLEHRSVTPSLAINTAADLDTSVRDNARLITLLQTWQNDAFRPDWTSSWGTSLVRYVGTGAHTAALDDTGTLESLTADAATLYQQSHDVNRLATASYSPNWPAFDDSTLFGLDPTKRFWLESLPRPQTTHITSLPVGNLLGANTLVTSKFGFFELPGTVSSFDFSNLFAATTGIRYQGADWPIAYGAVVTPSAAMTVGGVTHSGVFMHPPWQGQFGGEAFAEYSIPVGSGGQFRFSVGILDTSTCNVDGVTFRVTANDVEVYRQTYGLGTWHDGLVDLSAYANSTVALRIIANPGPQTNTSCDGSGWGQLSIAYPSPTISVPLVLGNGATFSGFTGDGSFTGTGSVSNVPVPGRFVVFTQPGAAVGNGTNLTNVPFEVWSGARGELVAPGGIFGAGSLTSVTAGGVTKTPVIFAHPPNAGRAVLSWTLAVPATPMKLGWAAGLSDDSASEDGVDFSVLINGVPYRQWTQQNGVWTAGSVELAQWQGQNVLFQLVTDSRANYNSDHAAWGDLIVSASGLTCSYSLSATQANVGAQGGQFSVNVTAAQQTCPWAATGAPSWVHINSGAGIGNGTVTYTVDQNWSAPRSAALTIAGQTFTITQAFP